VTGIGGLTGISGLTAILCLGAAASLPAQPVETRLLVRAVSADAKIIGTNVGGARITVRDVANGTVLSQGTQLGSTGSTERIMRAPRQRGARVFDTERAAGFVATLEIDEPTLVEVTAEGPLGTPQATQRSSTTLWLVPGEDVLGEGLVLVLHGFAIRLESPSVERSFVAGESIALRVHAEMLCGCPLTPGGLWDSDRIAIVARLLDERGPRAETELSYAGEPSTFAGTIVAPAPGEYRLEILAIDADRANFGRTEQDLRVAGGPSP
jgi:hypothetical protein